VEKLEKIKPKENFTYIYEGKGDYPNLEDWDDEYSDDPYFC
jgi:hypothetical protein